MKRRLTTFFLMILLLMSFSVTVSAKTKETYFEENGVRYCWVRGEYTEEPGEKVEDHIWVLVVDQNSSPISRLGDCDRMNEPGHNCDTDDDIWDRFDRLEYKWKLEPKAIMTIGSWNENGYGMVGAEFILLKQQIKTNTDGSYDLDASGKLQYENSEKIGSGIVELGGYAKIHLDEKKLDPTAEFHQLVLGQILTEEQMNEYSPLKNRWYVNLVPNAEGKYEIYSVTLAPSANITDPEELEASGFGKLGEGFVSEYDSDNKIFKIRNYYRVGDIIVDISINGFDGEIPSKVRTNITITGPNEYSKRIRNSETLKGVRMGEYTISYSNPVAVEGYIAETPIVTVQCPVDADPVTIAENNNTILLNRDHANARVHINYTYTALHVHEYDDGVVTYPNCEEEGYTTFTCLDPECRHSYRDEYVDAYGHNYEMEEQEATCLEDGYRIYTCTYCQDTYTEDGDSATGHLFAEKITEPTCKAKGYTTYTCEYCGLSYKDNEVDVLEHDYKESGTRETSCTENGALLYTCLLCGDVKEELIEEATGHKYDKGVITPPTCTEDGYTTYTCENEGCEYSYTGDEKKALEHKYESKVIEPTTEREGYTLYTCSVCQDTYTDDHKPKLPTHNDDDDDDDDSGSTGDNGGVVDNGGLTPPQSTTPPANVSSGTTSGNGSDTLIVKSVDELEQPLNGTTVALYNGQTLLRNWASSYENVSVLDNLEKFVKEGETVSLTLKQTKAPNGYEVSDDTFTVHLKKASGKTDITVKKDKVIGGSTIENGKDGKPIVTFHNSKKTTHIVISCDVDVVFSENCQVDEAVIAEYQEKQFEFVLKWKDAVGEEQTQKVLLSHGRTARMKAELPFGTAYEITAFDAEGNPVTGLSQNAVGTISNAQVDEEVEVAADLKYTVWIGDPLELELLVVDEKSGTSLEGAIFELRDPDGTKVGTYFSHKDGKVYISDVFHVTGDYLLTQIGATEGYEEISGAAPVMVSLTCKPSEENGAHILVQSMEAKIAHQAVSQDEDGVYRIKNSSADSVMAKPGGGRFTPGIIILLVVCGIIAVAGAVALIVLNRKKGEE